MVVRNAMYRTLCQDDVFWLDCQLNEFDDWDDEEIEAPVQKRREPLLQYPGYKE